MKTNNINPDKNIFRIQLQEIEYTTIEEALEKCKALIQQHQKEFEGREPLTNIIYFGGYSFVQ